MDVHEAASRLEAVHALSEIALSPPPGASRSWHSEPHWRAEQTDTLMPPPPPRQPRTARPAMETAYAIIEQKHARWQAQLRDSLVYADYFTYVLLQPAAQLDPLYSALHLSLLQPCQLALIEPTMRQHVIAFQQRAAQLGLLDMLPQVQRVHATMQARRHPAPSPLGAPQP